MLQVIRKYKFLGVALFDMVGSYAVASMVGSKFGANPIFSGLMAIPLGIATHALFRIETPLTKFFTDADNPHKYHGLIIGSGAMALTKALFSKSLIYSANVGLGTAIVASLYMAEHGHDLPPSLKRKAFRSYMKYQMWKNS